MKKFLFLSFLFFSAVLFAQAKSEGVESAIGVSPRSIESFELSVKDSSFPDELLDYDSASADFVVNLSIAWTANPYTVNYIGQDGVTTVLSEKLTGAQLPFNLSYIPTNPAGYTFAGWSLTPTGTTITDVTSGDLPSSGSAITLYSQWKDYPVTITYYDLSLLSDEKVEVIRTSDLPYNLTYKLEHGGLGFAGWSLSPPLAGEGEVISEVEFADLRELANGEYAINLYESLHSAGEFIAYPTVVTSSVTIKTSASNSTISVYSLAGVRVMQHIMTSSKEQINLSGLPAGMYIVREEETNSTTKIFVK